MPDFIFDYISPVHPRWNALMDEQDYIKLGQHLDTLSQDFRKCLNLELKAEEEALPFQCSIKFADDLEVQTLNRDFRGKDKPTNVLSFPDGETDFNDEGAEIFYLGDIILAFETISKESTEQHKDFKAHLLHLCVHGILHLLGHDHIDEDEAEIMESLEISLLKKCGIQNPYDV
jgi:probable rRNA maturation factor